MLLPISILVTTNKIRHLQIPVDEVSTRSKNSDFKKSVLKIGNVELFNWLIDKLDIPRRWKNRLKRYYWNEGTTSWVEVE